MYVVYPVYVCRYVCCLCYIQGTMEVGCEGRYGNKQMGMNVEICYVICLLVLEAWQPSLSPSKSLWATLALATQTLTTQTLTTPQPPARIGCHGLLLSTPSCMHNKIAWRACWKAKHAPINLMNSHRQGVSTVHIRLHINHHQSKTLSLPAGCFQEVLTVLKPMQPAKSIAQESPSHSTQHLVVQRSAYKFSGALEFKNKNH